MLVETPNRNYTTEGYLQLEEAAEYKSEYRDGDVPMTGGGVPKL